MSSTIVLRFTEDVLSRPERIQQLAQIVKSNPSYRYAILSAPGKGGCDEFKVTDALYMCHSQFRSREDYHDMFMRIRSTYERIINGLEIEFNLEGELKEIERNLISGCNVDYIASRGEFLIGKIVAKYFNWDFIDAKEMIFFRRDGTIDDKKSLEVVSKRLSRSQHAVIPSFYGTITGNDIKTFPRGICDTTGAIVSRAVNADYLEKWMYKTRPFAADPAIVKDPVVIRNMTYDEVIELNYMGVKVFEDDVALTLRKNKIPVLIRTLCHPEQEGTLISTELPEGLSRNIAVCIAGRKNFSVLHIEKFGINKQKDFGYRLFEIFSKYNVLCEHVLSGTHKVSIVFKSPMFDIRRGEIMEDIKNDLKADSVMLYKNLSLVAVIGKGMGTVHGVFAKTFRAIADANVKVQMIDQGSDDTSIIIGVHDEDFERTVNALYDTMIMN